MVLSYAGQHGHSHEPRRYAAAHTKGGKRDLRKLGIKVGIRLEHSYWECLYLQADDGGPNSQADYDLRIDSSSVSPAICTHHFRHALRVRHSFLTAFRLASHLGYWPTGTRRSRTNYDNNPEGSYPLSFLKFVPVPHQ